MRPGPAATLHPVRLAAIRDAGDRFNFTMPSDDRVGQLLRVLAAGKPGGRVLELGTGLGLSLA